MKKITRLLTNVALAILFSAGLFIFFLGTVYFVNVGNLKEEWLVFVRAIPDENFRILCGSLLITGGFACLFSMDKLFKRKEETWYFVPTDTENREPTYKLLHIEKTYVSNMYADAGGKFRTMVVLSNKKGTFKSVVSEEELKQFYKIELSNWIMKKNNKQK